MVYVIKFYKFRNVATLLSKYNIFKSRKYKNMFYHINNTGAPRGSVG